jgi:diphthamide synthase (EF-2-diphthine--ammonia ligase)
LALARCWTALGPPAALISLLDETGQRSRTHGLLAETLESQAEALGVPLLRQATSELTFEAIFSAQLHQLYDEGVRAVVFGTVSDLACHDAATELCQDVGMEAIHPLWNENSIALMREFLASSFSAAIVAIRAGTLPKTLLGMDLIYGTTLERIHRNEIDLKSGHDQYHTVVTAMPQFARPLTPAFGAPVRRGDFWIVDVAV